MQSHLVLPVSSHRLPLLVATFLVWWPMVAHGVQRELLFSAYLGHGVLSVVSLPHLGHEYNLSSCLCFHIRQHIAQSFPFWSYETLTSLLQSIGVKDSCLLCSYDLILLPLHFFSLQAKGNIKSVGSDFLPTTHLLL